MNPLSKENICGGLRKLRADLKSGNDPYENASGPLYWNVIFALDYMSEISDEYFDRLIERE